MENSEKKSSGNGKPPEIAYLSFSRNGASWVAIYLDEPVTASAELAALFKERGLDSPTPEIMVTVVNTRQETVLAFPAMKIFIMDVNNFWLSCQSEKVDPLKVFLRVYGEKFPDKAVLFVAYPYNHTHRQNLERFVNNLKIALQERNKKVEVISRNPAGKRNAKDIDALCSAEVAFTCNSRIYRDLTFFGGDGDYAYALRHWNKDPSRKLAIVSSRNTCSMALFSLGAEIIFLDNKL